MPAEAIIPAFDFIGTIGFLIAVGIGLYNYRDTDVEQPFWLAFSVTAALGALWLALVTLEWLGIQSELLDVFSTSMQAVVIGLFAIGVIGTAAVVNDLKRSHLETTHRASIVSILSRILRHNLRNDLTIIRGYLSKLDSDSTDVAVVQDRIDHLIGTSEKARTLEQTVVSQPHYDHFDLDDVLNHVATTVESEYPAASISIDTAPDQSIWAMPLFESALIELVENAAEHAGAEPQIEIRSAATDDSVTIIIHDDGPGLPEREQTLLTNEIETPLLHSSGIGLWVAQWIIRTHGGSITADVTESGTTITVMLPKQTGTAADMPADRCLDHYAYDRYHAIFDRDVSALLVLNDEERILDANSSAGELFATSTQDLLGTFLQDVIPDECTLSPDFQALDPGEIRYGTSVFPTVDSPGQVLTYVVKADVLLGEHLLVLRPSADYDAIL